VFASEGGFTAYGFPENNNSWSNRNVFQFSSTSATASNNGLYLGDGGATQFIDINRNLKNIGTISSGAITSGAITSSGKLTINTGSDDILTLNQTSTDTKWNYINFKNQGTREWFIGQDSDGNFDLYNDNIDAYAITVSLSDNSIVLNDNVNVAGNLVLNSNSNVVSARKFTARDSNGVMLTADDATSGLSIADNGNATFTGTVSASNLSGTNTGDQDLSGYVTLANSQTITGQKTFSGNVILDDGSGDTPILKFINGSDVNYQAYATSGGNFQITRVGSGGAELVLAGHATDYTLSTLSLGGAEISAAKIGNWNTAYSWGNHASAGYLTSGSTQSKYLRSDEADTATGKITFSQNAATIALAGTNHTYAEFYKTGISNGRSAYLGFGASGNNHFNIANEISSGKVIIDTNSGSVEINDNTTIDADLTVTGDLNITGDINSYNVTDLDVVDKTITIGKGQTEANSGGSGIVVDGSAASLLWDESDNRWEFNKNISASNFSGSSSGTNTGDQDLSGYLLNSTDTLNGVLTINTDTTPGLIVKNNSNSGTDASIVIRGSRNNPAAGVNPAKLVLQSYDSDASPATNVTGGEFYMEATNLTGGSLSDFEVGVRYRKDGSLIDGFNIHDGTFSVNGNIAASNFSGSHSGTSSGTNTGDQDLSGYLLNTTDELVGTLTIDSGTSMGLKIEHDTFAKGLELHREHADNAASIKFSNNSGETGIFYANASNKRPIWRPGGTTDNHEFFTDNYHPNADKWTTARTITLGGDLSGSVSIDGSANVTLSAQVTNNSHTHDDRYYTESEMQTFFKRGYIENHNASNLAVGWYTIATNTGDRATGMFQIWDTASSDHQSVIFTASHHFGTDQSNDITVLTNSRYSGTNFRYIRIKEAGTYDGAALQVYVDGTSNTVAAAIVGANAQQSGWVLKDWVADATDPGDVDNYSSFTEKCKLDLDNIINGGIATTGLIYSAPSSGTATAQYRVLTQADEGDGNGIDADTLDGNHASDFQASGNYITGSGSLSAQDLTDIGNLSGTNTGDQVSSDFTHDDLTGYVANEHIDWTADYSATDQIDAANIPSLATSKITSGTFVNARISSGSVTQHEGDIDHDALTNYVANEHIDWSAENAGIIHSSNISFPSDNNTFRTVKVDTNNDGTVDTTLGATEDLKFIGGTAITLAENNGRVTINGVAETYTAHDNITAASSVDNSGNTFIQDLTLDSNGHVTGVVSAGVSIPTHDNLSGYVANEHIDWTAEDSSNIHINNIPDLSGTYLTSLSGAVLTSGAQTVAGTKTFSSAIIANGGIAIQDLSDTTITRHSAGHIETPLYRIFDDGYHPNADKWTTARTITLGGDLSGSVSIDGSANVTLTATVANDSHSHSNYITSNANDTVSANTTWNDSKQARFGTGGDLKIQHNGTNSYIDNHTGHLYIRGNATSDLGKDIFIQAKSGEASIYAFDDADVELYYNNSKKFSTTSNGFECNGTEIDTSSNGGGYKIGFNVSDNFSFSGYDVAHYGISNAGNDTGGGIVLSGYFGIRFATNGSIRGHFSNTGTFTTSGDIVGFGSPSDISLKENIKPIDNALDKVCKLKGVTFDWKESDSILEIKEDIGFIAQDVQEVLPELIKENDNGKLSLRDKGIVPVLVEAIKELKAEIDELKKCNKCKNCNCNA